MRKHKQVTGVVLQCLTACLILSECGARDVQQQSRPYVAPTKTASPTHSSWTSCQSTVCHRIKEEAEGLARVKLLRGYVTETVRLLDSLMLSMDNELVNIAQEMNEFVGPHCEEAHAMLAQVAVPLEQNTGDHLSMGIMEESTAQKLEEQSPDSDEDLAGDIERTTERKDPRNSNTNDWQSPNSAGRGRQLHGGQSTFSDRSGHGETSQSGWNNNGYGTENNFGENTDSSWSASGTQESGQWHGQTSQGTTKYPSNQGQYHTVDNQGSNIGGQYPGNNRYNHHGGGNQYDSEYSSGTKRPQTPTHGSSTNWRPVVTGPTCKGLPGSPFTVPGIDSWCVQNCAQGYCPASHCICG